MTSIRIHHTAVAVADLSEAIPRYERLSAVRCDERLIMPEQQIEAAFLPMGDTFIELIAPIGSDSGIARFVASRGESLHHIGILVDDIRSELARLTREGIQLIDRAPRAGAHGLIAFVHPRGTGGILLELVQLS